MATAQDADVPARGRTMTVLWVALEVSVAIYLALGWLVESQQHFDVARRAAMAQAASTTLCVLPILMLLLANLLYRRVAPHPDSLLALSGSQPASAEAKLQSAMICALAIDECVVIGGLQLRFLGAPFEAFVPFAAIGAGLMFYHWRRAMSDLDGLHLGY